MAILDDSPSAALSTVCACMLLFGMLAVATPVAGSAIPVADSESTPTAQATDANTTLQSGFTAYGQNGSITLGGQQDDPIVLPQCDGTTPQDPADEAIEWEDECFTLSTSDVEIGANGTEATFGVSSENVTFPQIKTTDVNADYANVSLSAPEGLNGTIDLQTGAVNITGMVTILVEVRGSILGDADCETETTLDLTTETGAAGILEGERLSINETAGTGTTTVVADAFSVPSFETKSGSSLVCGSAEDQYNLPATQSGQNTFQFELFVDLDR